MAHFAEIDADKKVLRIIVISNLDTLDQDGNESEAVGVAFCQKNFGGDWVQTSYNGTLRKQFAGVGFTYDATSDVFIAPQPYPSWQLNSQTHDWDAPTPKPDDGRRYIWDESLAAWRDITDKLAEMRLSS
jgi:hypothetical protein